MGLQPAKELLVLNPKLYSDLEKYVWISDSFKVHREAQRFFVFLLKKGIYVKGFATDTNSMFNLKMYNKKIYDISTLDMKCSIVFYDIYLGRSDVELPKNVYNARLLNPELPRENIVIWGSGITGKRVYNILSENGVRAECYVDSNKNLECTYKFGLPVYTSEYLENFSETPTIIVAMEKWEELDICIREKYERRYFFSFVENAETKNSSSDKSIKLMFDLTNWGVNFAYFINKKVYVYGFGDIENELIKYLSLLDINFGGILKDGGIENNEISVNYDVKQVEDVLYENDFFVWVHDRKRVKRLEELGLISHKNYICYYGANNTLVKRMQILDTNLGHNYLADSRYPGIMVYGDEKENDYKIVALGGSTTDGRLYSFKSWPELMYDRLHDKGVKNVTIYNGGVVDYTSGQELVKLIRDAIVLKPNMIIVYDGFNDLNKRFSYPLTNGYLKKVFDFASENMENDEDDNLFAGKNALICEGIEAKVDMFDAWLSNIRTMYAVAMERRISFYSFCQPVLSSKKCKTEKEKNMLLSVNSPAITNLMEHSFRKQMCQMFELPKYMYDLSHIFDNEKEVYMDHCHVWEKGNEIIAREITKVILPELCSV